MPLSEPVVPALLVNGFQLLIIGHAVTVKHESLRKRCLYHGQWNPAILVHLNQLLESRCNYLVGGRCHHCIQVELIDTVHSRLAAHALNKMVGIQLLIEIPWSLYPKAHHDTAKEFIVTAADRGMSKLLSPALRCF